MPEAESPEVVARVEAALSLVDSLARQVARAVGAYAELDDLISYGREGLLDAARRFDPERGVPFRAYASYRVRGAIIDGMRASGGLPRRAFERLVAMRAADRVSAGAAEDTLAAPPPAGSGPAEAERALCEHLAAMATALAVGLLTAGAYGDAGELVAVSGDQDPESAVAEAELLAVVRRAIAELPHEEQELVRRHYLEGERFDLVAQDLGLSKSWASRLHTRAIGRLTKRLRRAAG
jgi:RNA polymerase sigma factor for flagellar operon FliA